MKTDGERRGIEFVDSLLQALGVGSVTTEAIADQDWDVEEGLRTGFYGKSFFSTKNRDVLLAILRANPNLITLDELRQALVSSNDDAAATVLQAVERVCERRPEARLEELMRDR